MVTAISSWAEQIIIAIMIATIFEMILPDCKNKKYVKTVIGLYILFTILSPIIKNIPNGDVSFASSEYTKKISENFTSYTKIDDVKNNNIHDTYILSLKQDIQGKLNKKGYVVATMNIEIEKEDEDTYGQINNLIISLSKKPQEEKISDSNILVNKIQIENTVSNSKTANSKISNDEIKQLKEYLSSEYGVKSDNIKID